LAGPTLTYRINGDAMIMQDIRKTIKLFDNFYIDREKDDYFSHIDPVAFDPRAKLWDATGRGKTGIPSAITLRRISLICGWRQATNG